MKLRVKIQNRTYEVEVGDLLSRPIKATIDGQVFEVWPEEAASQPGAALPAAPGPAMPAPWQRPCRRPFPVVQCWHLFPASLFRLM
jgi:hypothetical protein